MSLWSVASTSLVLSLLLTFVVRGVSRRLGFVARPRSERWHRAPTALAGGVGIFVAFATTALLLGGRSATHLIVGGAAMLVLGLIDDVVHLKPYAKLIGQVSIAALTVLSGATLPWTSIPTVDQAVSLFWFVGITNAINLLDNMDGLAGGVACIA